MMARNEKNSGSTLSAEDKLELRDLVDKYGFAVDSRNGALFASLFLEDGVLAIYDPGSDAPVLAFQGTQALSEIPSMVDVFHNTFHLMANHYLEIDADTVSGLVYGISLHLDVRDGKNEVDTMMVQRYKDTYMQTREGWRFVRREVHRQWTETHLAERASLADTLGD